MKFIADFHIHSKYSRATSQQMTVENIAKWAKIKGIKVIGTGDFTHPFWFKELKEKLVPAEPGLFKWKEDINSDSTRFLLTAETSHIYSKKGKVHRVHLIIFAPSFETAEKINTRLSWIGNLKSDGRPILGLDAKELVKIVLDSDPQAIVVPSHAWTPWFSVFGSMSGFNSLEECFDDLTPHIFAGETGLSSDPAMNWRLSKLDKITLISNSDSHSLEKLGREANVFDTELSYSAIVEAIKTKDPKKFLFTIEFFPEEGKYHYDGHRLCGVRLAPEQTRKLNGKCPQCGRGVTIGVMNRVEELADRPVGYKPSGAIPYKSLVPLGEIIAEALGLGVASKSVKEIYNNLITKFGSEFSVLIEADPQEIKKITPPKVGEGILRVREGRIKIEPGYDGQYGKLVIFEEAERSGSPISEQINEPSQKSLF
mgnify:CR=1 FL=1